MSFYYEAEIKKLRTFKKTMLKLKVEIGTFEFQYNEILTDVIFDTRSSESWEIIFMKVGIGKTLTIPIKLGYKFTIDTSKKYQEFISFFNIKNGKGKFSIKSFKGYFNLFYSILYGDLLMSIYHQSVAYEENPGDSKSILAYWKEKLISEVGKKPFKKLKENYKKIIEHFLTIPKNLSKKKIRVGIVGEIYMKYSPLGNNHLTDYLEKEGVEAVNTGLLDFLLFNLYDTIFDRKIYGRKGLKYYFVKYVVGYIEKKQKEMIDVIKQYKSFIPPSPFAKVREMTKGYLGHGVKMGEGWLLTAEMLEFIEMGVKNIVCAQPFGCLPNHIIAKGMIRKIKDNHPEANIIAVDYDPGASSVNQENRIRLMLENARMLATE